MTPAQRRNLARAFRAIARLAAEGAELAAGDAGLNPVRRRAEAVRDAAAEVVAAIVAEGPASALIDRIAHAMAQQAAPNVTRIESRRRRAP